MNTKMLYIMIISLFLIFLVYILMLMSTNSVVKDAENVMLGNVEKSITDGTPLSAYNRKGDFNTVSVDVRITRRFVLHNFFNGYVWIKYTCQGFDADGNRTYGSWNISSRWKIHWESGKWEIVKINENP